MNVKAIARITGGKIIEVLEVDARIKTKEEYNWFKFTGKRSISITHGNGKTTVVLNTDDVYGLRPSSDHKHYRLVTKKTGLTKVFTVGDDLYRKLAASGTPSRVRVVPHRIAASDE